MADSPNIQDEKKNIRKRGLGIKERIKRVTRGQKVRRFRLKKKTAGVSNIPRVKTEKPDLSEQQPL